MPIFINPTGNSSFGIAICDRCKRKFPIGELMSDPNSPGLKVCKEDRDHFDPYRLPARQTERIVLPFNRPDVPVADVDAPLGFTLADVPLRVAEDNDIREAQDNDLRLIDED